MWWRSCHPNTVACGPGLDKERADQEHDERRAKQSSSGKCRKFNNLFGSAIQREIVRGHRSAPLLE